MTLLYLAAIFSLPISKKRLTALLSASAASASKKKRKKFEKEKVRACGNMSSQQGTQSHKKKITKKTRDTYY